MAISAVITADIVNSTKLSTSQGKKLSDNLISILEKRKYEFYRGDSFQVYLKSPVEALSVALQLRTAAMKLLPKITVPVADIRVSIGIAIYPADGETADILFKNADKAMFKAKGTEKRVVLFRESVFD